MLPLVAVSEQGKIRQHGAIHKATIDCDWGKPEIWVSLICLASLRRCAHGKITFIASKIRHPWQVSVPLDCVELFVQQCRLHH